MLRFRAFFWAVGGALFCAAIAPSQTSQAAVLTVTTAADSGPGSLRDVVLSAVNGDIVQFDSTLNGQTINLTTGGISINGGVTIDGPGASLLTVRRADEAPSFLIFHTFGIVPITISGLTIANGAGGIRVESHGGGSLTIVDCRIIDHAGTGVFCGHGINPPNEVTIINSTISGNAGDYGGGVYNAGATCLGCVESGPCHMTINNTTIAGNSATQGGGIYSFGFLTVMNSTISGNIASLGQSGGGGGIATGGTTTLTNSTISGNSAYQGGGIVHLENNLLFYEGNDLTLTNTTITANSATEGGGIYTVEANFVTHTRNSIVALNVAPSGPDVEGPMSSDGFNLVGSDSGPDISPLGSDQIGTPDAPIDPLLAPLQDNGGPTFTHALLLGSPAFDKGHSSGSTTDQRGFTRPVDLPDIPNAPGGDGSDIGAFESAGIATLANISTRVQTGAGNSSMIGGFIITGTETKTVIVRGIGPSLFIPGLLADPIIEVHGSSGELLATNDNWRDADTSAEIQESGLAPTNDLESALWGIINPGSYTVIVRGTNNSTGIGLFEVYDLDQTVSSRLGNISTRGFVGTSDDVMVGGTIVLGNHPARVLLRAIGPSLTDFGIPNALLDPVLELHDGNGVLLLSNDNWRSDQEAEIIATGIPPTDDQESAVLRDLAPGNYTAIVRGANNTTGIAVVEAYELN